MNITIVGAGTSGNLAALFCNKYFPKATVQVIEDLTTGIIGVGESTTPALLDMLAYLDITLSEMVINCGATLKNATRFTNWSGKNDIYHHGFNVKDEYDLFLGSNKNYYSSKKISLPNHKSLLGLYGLYYSNSVEDLHLSSILSYANKVPFEQGTLTDNYAAFGLHFDAKKVADFLKHKGTERGIEFINGKVIASELNEKGYVEKIILSSGGKYEVDFIFDCSGFNRLFVEKTYKSKFNSFSNFLPVKKAIPFFIQNESTTPTYTESIALKYGWMWKTPVGNRFGCGYVFDSDYINQDQAYDEVTSFLGFRPEVSRCLNFDSGYFEKVWNKNVLAIGLSSGFLEPLEATSIWITVISLNLLTEHISGIVMQDESAIEEYNIEFSKNIASILALVQFHYLTNRNDSKFWIEFREKNILSPLLYELLDLYKNRTPSMIENYKYFNFPMFSWLLVGSGIEYFPRHIIEKEFLTYNIKENISHDFVQSFKSNLQSVTRRSYDHDEFLNILRQE